ncbi:TldD/PmbA family protein [soil metagenome]
MLDLSALKSEVISTSTYSEVRYQENLDLRMTLLNGQLVSNLQESSRGISARSFAGGYWGFSSHSSPTKESALRALKEASRNASFLGGKKSKKAALVSTPMASFEKSYATGKAMVASSEWIDFLKALDAKIVAKYPTLKSRSITIAALDMEKQLLTSNGTTLYSLVPRAHIHVTMTKDSASGPVSAREVRGGLGHLQDCVSLDAGSYDAWLDRIYEMVSEKAEGVIPQAGTFDVILDADLAGILAHEAVGHTVEGDLVLGGSIAGGSLQKQVASPLVSLVDFAHTYGGVAAPQPVHVDDEGVLASDTTIIDKGILKTFMNNRETADHFGQAATGHARAFTFADEPLIRMRNTAILPGQSKMDQMISSIENGYYLAKPGNGQADTTGEFMFAAGYGFEIKNGKRGRTLRETTISGVAFEMLKSVSMISDDFAWESAGYCGKKQPMPVGMGGPAIKCRVQVGGQ